LGVRSGIDERARVDPTETLTGRTVD